MLLPMAHEVGSWYIRQCELLLAIRPFLDQADIMRLDGLSHSTASAQNNRRRLTNDENDN